MNPFLEFVPGHSIVTKMIAQENGTVNVKSDTTDPVHRGIKSEIV